MAVAVTSRRGAPWGRPGARRVPAAWTVRQGWEATSGLPRKAATHGMTDAQWVWARQDLLDTVTPMAVSSGLDDAALAGVVWEVER